MKKVFLLTIALISSCSLEPNYTRPEVDLPLQPAQNPHKKKTASISWEEFFQSADLQRIIKLALENNKDLKIAANNVEIAEGTHGVARSSLFPTISGLASETRQKAPSAFAIFTPKKQFRANIGFTSYEIDFFGRLRNLKKAALEDYLSTKEAHNIAKISVISQTANAYAQLLLDIQLAKIAKNNLELIEQRYNLIAKRYNNHIDSKPTLLVAESALENAKVDLENYTKAVEQDKNALMALTGTFNDNAIPQNKTIDEIKIAEELLDFVPSENLLLRPDIKQAEHDLISANANIGAARAAFFPSITLTGSYGYASRQLDTLLDARTWSYTPQINLPIFSGGRNIANLDVAHARKNQRIVQYEKAIQTAFREVLDELATKKAVNNQLKSYEKILLSSENLTKIAASKNRVGLMSKMDVINAEIAELTAKENQLISKKESIANLIAIYKVMGGGASLD